MSRFSKFEENPKLAKSVATKIKDSANYLEENELKSISDNKKLKELKSRIENYLSTLDKIDDSIEEIYKQNANLYNEKQKDGDNPFQTFLNGQQLNDYIAMHNAFKGNVRNFRTSFQEAQKSISEMNSRIKREQEKLKVKKQQQAAASYY